MSEFREFWVYRNEEYAPTYACDFNQRGFVPSRNRESIHVIEYSALEQAEAKIKDIEAKLEKCKEQRNKYHSVAEMEGMADFTVDELDNELEKLRADTSR